VATIATPSLSDGTHIVTAIYSGDSNLVGQTKATLVQNVNATLQGYFLSASPTSATLHPGQSAKFVVTATPNPLYLGTVSFSCGTLPAGVNCSFSPASITLSGISPASTTLTVTVAPSMVALVVANPTSNTCLPLVGMTFGLLGWVALGGLRRAGYKQWTWVVTLVATAIMLAATGCGGSGNNQVMPAPRITPVKVIAASQGGAGSQQLNLTLNIWP
jgi:hypothetical protein